MDINSIVQVPLVIALVIVVLPALSYLVEGLRPRPLAPTVLPWDPRVPIRYVDVNGLKLRYITVGEGPPLVLLHTLRTQLDMFQKLLPRLSPYFTIYALDYPGHGFSDIPRADYTPETFVKAVNGFCEKLNLNDVIMAGVSIGGTIPLVLAARHNSRLKKVIGINPYDYDQGRGILRSSLLAKVLFSLNNVPVLGATIWRLRSLFVFRRVMQGGVYQRGSLPEALLVEMNDVGNRPNHYKAFMSLVKHFPEWETVRSEYKNIEIPVLLVYGDHDWTTSGERQSNVRAISGAKMETVENAGHFLSLDAPEALSRLIMEFCGDDVTT